MKHLTWILLLLAIPVHAQITYRSGTVFEDAANRGDTLIGMEENGFLLLHRSTRHKKFRLLQYNDRMEEVAATELDVRDISQLNAFRYENNQVCFFFRTGLQSVAIAVYSATTHTSSVYTHKVPLLFMPRSIYLQGQSLLVEGFEKGSRRLYRFHLTDKGKSEVVWQESYNISMVDMQRTGKSVAVFRVVYTDSIPALSYFTVSEKGDGSEWNIIPSDSGRYPFTARLLSISETETIITGQYKRQGRSGSQGIYFMRLQNGTIAVKRFYSFDRFKYLDATGAGSDVAEEEMARERKAAANHPDHRNLYLLEHPLLASGNGYISVMERCIHTINYAPMTNTINHRGMVVVGGQGLNYYQYTGSEYVQLLAVSFDLDGNLRWDQAAALPPHYTYTGHCMSRSAVEAGGLKVVFLWQESIHVVSISADGVIQEQQKAVEKDRVEEPYETRGYFLQLVLMPGGRLAILGHKERHRLKGAYVVKGLLALQLYYVL